jgi:hypothetical protein
MKVRFISQSSADGNLGEEYITITDDLEGNQEDYLISGMSIDTDFTEEVDFPSAFPMNHTFKKE